MVSEMLFNNGHPDGSVFELNHGNEDCMVARSYRANRLKQLATWLAVVLSLGVLGVLFYWKRHWYIRWTCSPVTVTKAQYFIIDDTYKMTYVSPARSMAKDCHFYTKPPPLTIVRGSPLVVPSPGGVLEGVDNVRYFDCKRVRYIWSEQNRAFERLEGLKDIDVNYLVKQIGLSDVERSQRLKLFGVNNITIKQVPVWKLLLQQLITPFYIFQLYCICVWYAIPTYPLTTIIVILTIISLSLQVWETYSMQKALNRRVQDHGIVRVLKKDGKIHEIPSQALVPGDVVLIPQRGWKVVFDGVLLSGTCIVDESNLNGESVPVSKVMVTSLHGHGAFDIRTSSRSILFCGTRVRQAQPGSDGLTRVMVIRTGFMTQKGELMRRVIYFPRADLKFQRQTYVYVLAMAVLGLVGMIYGGILMSHDPTFSDGDKAIHIVAVPTTMIPPILPTILTLGLIFSHYRLRAMKIFCLNPRSINMCGLTNLICFDKTGTLTEQELDLRLVQAHAVDSLDPSDIDQPLVRAMASCHSLSLMRNDENSVRAWAMATLPLVGNSDDTEECTVIGDPMDLILFRHTKWSLEEKILENSDDTKFSSMRPPTGHEDDRLTVLKEFPFVSGLQRMGVVVLNSRTQGIEFFAKGAPERIIELCDPNSVPADWTDEQHHHSKQGYRVVALAWKPLDVNLKTARTIERSSAEANLQYLGLIILENRIKPDSHAVIEELYEANMRSVMLTGDNIHTAITVARTCGLVRPHQTVKIIEATKDGISYMLDDQPITEPLRHWVRGWRGEALNLQEAEEGPSRKDVITLDDFEHERLALTGTTLQAIREFHPQEFSRILLQGTIFARVSPFEKQFMVEKFQEVGYKVAMCGDGANDCGAMRAAHAGISLSDTEAAAGAPFTSTSPRIACVPIILREGRCALVTFFAVFFFFAGFSVAQNISMLQLYYLGKDLSEFEYIYQYLFQLTILSIVMAMTKPCEKLDKKPAPSSLKSLRALTSFCGHVALLTGFQVIVNFVVQTQRCNVLQNLVDNSTITVATTAATTLFPGASTTSAGVDNLLAFSDDTCQSYALWNVACMQILVMSLVFAKGRPFRLPFWTNHYHMLALLCLLIFGLVCMLGPTDPIRAVILFSKPESVGFRFVFLAISIGYGILAFIFEWVVIDIWLTNLIDTNTALRRFRPKDRKDVEESLRRAVLATESAHSAPYPVIEKF